MAPFIERLLALGAELRRRRVLRAAGLYLVAAWAVIEVTATVFPLLYLPEWTSRAVVFLAVLGLPIVLVLSWAFDITPEGVRRTGPDPERRVLPATGRAAMVVLTVILTTAVGWSSRGLWLTAGPVGSTGTAALDPSRVAVLYFDDFSPGEDLGFLADGLTEALIHELAQVETLEVVSRYGVKPFREVSVPWDSLARALRAGTLVEGSVEGYGDRLAATVQMIDGRTGAHLLSHRVERGGADMLVLRDSIVSEATRVLGRALGRELDTERRRSATRNAAAWEDVERARRLIDEADTLRWTLGDVDAARSRLRDADSLLGAAADRDPTWAEPLLLRARVSGERARLSALGRQDGDVEALEEGIRYTEQAIERAPGSAEAYAWRGTLRAQLSWIGDERAETLLRTAEEDLRRALVLDGGVSLAWVSLADLLRSRGEFAEAAIAAERALEADPFLVQAEQPIVFTLGHIWLELEQFDRALEWAREGHRRYPADPGFAAARLVIMAGWADARAEADSAWAMVRAVEEEYGMESWPHGHLQVAAVLARAGQADSARAVIDAVRRPGGDDPWLDYYEANVRLQLGESEAAVDLLESFVRAMPHRRPYIARDWWWKPLRGSARFQQLGAHP